MKSNAQAFQPPRRTRRSPSATRRMMPRISAQVRSAVDSVSTSGVLVTTTPSSRAVFTSMLLMPTATADTTLRSGSPASSTARSTVSGSSAISPCLPRTRATSSSWVRNVSRSLRSTSQVASRRASAADGSRLVTSTVGLDTVSWRLGAGRARRWTSDSVAVRLAVAAVIALHAGLDHAAALGIAGRQHEQRVAAVTGHRVGRGFSPAGNRRTRTARRPMPLFAIASRTSARSS